MHWIKGTIRKGSDFARKGSLWGCGWHTGVDYISPVGNTVQYPYWAPGRVVEVGTVSWGRDYGTAIIIQIRPGVRYLAAHLSEVEVKVGDRVTRGRVLGRTGNTGKSTGPHIHIEKRVSPYRYALDARRPQEIG